MTYASLKVKVIAARSDESFFFSGFFVFFIFGVNRRLLIEQKSFRIILAASVAMFLIGLGIHFTAAGDYPMSGALLGPLLTLALFRLCRRVFLRYLKREPKETFLVSEKGLAPDMLFNFLYFVSAVFVVMLVTVIMEQLAKAY